MKILTTCLMLLLFIRCSEQQNNDSKDRNNGVVISIYPEMLIEKNENNWGADIVLNIQQTEKISAELTAYKVVSLYKGLPVGFYMMVKQPAGKNTFVNEGVRFSPLKDTSNNFLKALAEVYGIPPVNAIFRDSVIVTYADLEAMSDAKTPGNWAAAQKKLFFETDEETPELFLNIDEAAGTISFPEKDKDYRTGIIQALSKKIK